MDELKVKFEQVIWIAKTLFKRSMVTGSTGNISFRNENDVYISGSGTCFGTIKEGQFSRLSLKGNVINSVKPSKEYPLHLMLYKNKPEVQAVIHTHSFYSVLYSCIKHENESDIIPSYTPYLKMKVGKVGLIPYEKPGSEELFSAMEKRLIHSDAYILKQHGTVVSGKTLMDAFMD